MVEIKPINYVKSELIDYIIKKEEEYQKLLDEFAYIPSFMMGKTDPTTTKRSEG